ncbi:amidohydrolase family protein [Azospirillum sp. CT11-132]|jgi:N-acyl-D-amino-acid deacylase|uniref:N-acyl-D-amino-acid deacylase family protein n=1 Tax=unclassified Azospirillum TaxID=2630922 RepID=UPI000D64808B|nr:MULTISPECIES: D-aminoacylase [unclassified Azospirillum]
MEELITPSLPQPCGGDGNGEPRPLYDVVLRNGMVADGSGRPAFTADVAIAADRIVAVGPLTEGSGALELDVTGLVVAPGFIDVHTHDDRLILIQPEAEPKVTQGVTTVVTGNCGVSLAPVILDSAASDGIVPAPLNVLGKATDDFFGTFPAYLAAVEGASPAVNVVPLVGHMGLRASVGADPARAASEGEVAAMRAMLDEAMRAGAFGFSTGLAYPFSRNAPMEEVVALASVAGRYGAVYTTHMRDEGEGVLASLEESFATARAAGVRLVISHHKCLGLSVWGRSVLTLAAIDAATVDKAAGVSNIALDAYPYTASSTVLLPEKLQRSSETWVTWSTPFPEATGRRVDDIAADWGCTPEEAAERLAPAGAIYVNMDEADVRRILKHRLCMIGSDGLPHDQHPHPRLWGTFPRVLGHYCRETGLFTLEEAVHRMTGLPARQFGIADRGTVSVGAFADLCVFDPATVCDCADFRNPTKPAAGIVHVFVNGQPVLRDGGIVGARPGRVIRNPHTSAA